MRDQEHWFMNIEEKMSFVEHRLEKMADALHERDKAILILEQDVALLRRALKRLLKPEDNPDVH